MGGRASGRARAACFRGCQPILWKVLGGAQPWGRLDMAPPGKLWRGAAGPLESEVFEVEARVVSTKAPAPSLRPACRAALAHQ